MQLLPAQNAKSAQVFTGSERAIAKAAMDGVPGFIGLAEMRLVPGFLNFVCNNAKQRSVVAASRQQLLGLFVGDREKYATACHSRNILQKAGLTTHFS
jgi:hypothetical protein